MTVTSPNALGEGRDLSSTFGAAAVSSLRGPNGANGGVDEAATVIDEPPAAEPEAPTPETMEDDVQHSTNRRAAETQKAATPKTGPRTARRRLRVAPVRDRRQIDVLLLAVASMGPANGREFIELVREHSDGVFLLSERAVYHEIHRLKNNRLIRVTSGSGSRRHLLTALGERVLETRRREWNAFSHGFDGVLDAVDRG